MRLLRSTLAFALGCALIAGCSGGGNSTPVQPASTVGQSPVGTTSLTITLPPNVQYATRKSPASATTRHGQFIDPAPTSGPTAAVLSINVNGIAIPGNPVSLAAGLSSNGYTYTAASIPVYSGYNTIYVAEYTDSSLSVLLASGYSNEFYASPGSTGTTSVIMNMNVTGIATTNSATGAGASVLTEGQHICAAGVPVIYFYAVDPLNGFVASPYGGIPDIQINSQSSAGTSVLSRNALGGFVPTFDGNQDPISVELGLAWTVSYYNIDITIYNAPIGC